MMAFGQQPLLFAMFTDLFGEVLNKRRIDRCELLLQVGQAGQRFGKLAKIARTC